MVKSFKDTKYSISCVQGHTKTFETKDTDTGGYGDSFGVTDGTVNSWRYSCIANRFISWIAMGYGE